jgi:hypothetical protein
MKQINFVAAMRKDEYRSMAQMALNFFHKVEDESTRAQNRRLPLLSCGTAVRKRNCCEDAEIERSGGGEWTARRRRAKSFSCLERMTSHSLPGSPSRAEDDVRREGRVLSGT